MDTHPTLRSQNLQGASEGSSRCCGVSLPAAGPFSVSWPAVVAMESFVECAVIMAFNLYVSQPMMGLRASSGSAEYPLVDSGRIAGLIHSTWK